VTVYCMLVNCLALHRWKYDTVKLAACSYTVIYCSLHCNSVCRQQGNILKKNWISVNILSFSCLKPNTRRSTCIIITLQFSLHYIYNYISLNYISVACNKYVHRIFNEEFKLFLDGSQTFPRGHCFLLSTSWQSRCYQRAAREMVNKTIWSPAY